MAATGSVTPWLHRLGASDSASAQLLGERYIDRLVRLAGLGTPGWGGRSDQPAR